MPSASPPSAPGSPSQAQNSPPQNPSEGEAGSSELEVLEPEESEASADASAEPTWDEGESGGEESLAEAAESGGGASGGGEESLEEGAEAGATPAGGGTPGGSPGGTPGDSQTVAGQPAMGGGAPSGSEEALDAELQSSLEIFEGEMERTITVLASNDPSDGEEAGGRAGGGAEEEGEGGPFDQTGGGAELVMVNGDPSLLPGASDEDGEQGGEPATGRPGLEGGGSANETYPRIPADVGSGEDDDVVARQIREAAINEDDPSLREKLWEEYRNYKRSIQ